MEHRIIEGDCIERMRELQNESVDMIFADPPYYMRNGSDFRRYESTDYAGCDDEWDEFKSQEQYQAFTRNWLTECKRVLRKTGTIWVIGGMQCVFTIGHIMQELGFWFINDVIWNKTNPTPNFRGSKLTSSHQTILWARSGKNAKYTFNYWTSREMNGNEKQMGSVWTFPVCKGPERLRDGNGNKLHSTQKPFGLMQRIVLISTKPGDVILDPFGGTMTTACAAKSVGRSSISIQVNGEYCKAGLERLQHTDCAMDDIANAVKDVKPVHVTLGQMVSDGFLKAGEGAYANGVPLGIFTKSGKILHDGVESDIHTYAAKVKSSRRPRLNGFDHWCVLRDGELKTLKALRDEYRDYINGKVNGKEK